MVTKRKTENADSPREHAGERFRGSKQFRSEIVTVRLDPKLHYLLELAARKQRRTVSSFIEGSIEDSLRKICLDDSQPHQSVAKEGAELLWDIDEADRFAKLAVRHPELLYHDEQILWKQIQETPSVWIQGKAKSDDVILNTVSKKLDLLRLRKQWPQLKAVAKATARRGKDWQE